jgi:hypothetical protein
METSGAETKLKKNIRINEGWDLLDFLFSKTNCRE